MKPTPPPPPPACAALLAVLLLASAGCLTDLTAAGARVQLGKVPPAAECRELGIVIGSGGGGGYTSSDMKLESALNELRNRAAERGGDFVVTDASGSDVGGIAVSGRAFDCSRAPLVTVPASNSAPSKAQPSVEERLRKLKDLRDKGLITPDDYDQRRRAIVNEV